MSSNKKLANIAIAILLCMIASQVMIFEEGGDAKAWTDGNRDSPVRPNYGIQDMIADKAFKLLENRSSEKAEFIRYWFLQDGPDDNEDSYDGSHLYPLSDDNFLAWTDDGPEGVTVEYFINNPEPGQDPQTDAVQYAQLLANRTMANLTGWMLAGQGSDDPDEIQLMHAAAYNAGKLAKYVGDMSQFGHTDYSKWDQLSQAPEYHTSEIKYPFREYYEAKVWSDVNMEILYNDFWDNRTFEAPEGNGYDKVHTMTSDLAKWVNSRGEDPVQMVDYDGETITVGYNYEKMLSDFMYNWNKGNTYNSVRGFNQTLWELTLENLVASAENLSAIYETIYDDAWERFLVLAPEINLVNWSVHPDPVIAGDLVMVNATLRNDGSRIAREFRILLEGPNGFTNWEGLTLEPGQEKNISFFPFEIGEGQEEFTITLDYEEKIAESDEENNVITGTVTPIPEVHSSMLELTMPFDTIRRDSNKTLYLNLLNTGNRIDTFNITGASSSSGLEVTTPDPMKVKKAWKGYFEIDLRCYNDAGLGMATVTITATGSNSSADLEIPISIIERSSNPVPVITGPRWGRIGEEITLSALDSYDSDGDSLYFTWIIPLLSNSTANEITINYTKPDIYDIELVVFDGNVTSSLMWPLRIYPLVPENISTEIADKGVSAVTISWEPWKAGGLVAYWLEATALPGQGEKSERGPYLERIGFGNSSGRIGKFLPGTEIEIKVNVEAERFGNVTMSTLKTTTQTLDDFENTFKMVVEDSYLKIDFKPWIDPEGVRDPTIIVERLFEGEFIPIDAPREDIWKTKLKDSIRYPLGSNFGSYRAHLTYYWVNETVSPFDLYQETVKENSPPGLNLTGWNQEFMLNINGTCRVWLVLGVEDPQDSINVTVSWGDGETERYDFYVDEEGKFFQSLFHNYSEIRTYEVSIKVVDWEGKASWNNVTLDIKEYKETKKGEEEERSIWTLVGIIILGIFIIIVLVIMGIVAYKVSKKDTEVEFKMKDFKSELQKEKAGTGTDFDQRRNLQIPTESIMGGGRSMREETGKEESPKLKKISGTITFDEE